MYKKFVFFPRLQLVRIPTFRLSATKRVGFYTLNNFTAPDYVYVCQNVDNRVEKYIMLLLHWKTDKKQKKK